MAAAKEREKIVRWKTVNFYEALGLAPIATQVEVKKGFKRVALACHPDKVPEVEREAATKRFQLIAEAYEVLANETSRRQYDQVRPRGGGTARQPEWVPQRPARQDTAAKPQPSRQAPQPQAAGPRFGFGGFNAGPRCEGCDRRCPPTDMRNCSECEQRGLISGICPRCTMCAVCAPEEMYGSDAEEAYAKKPCSGSKARSQPPGAGATPKRVWRNVPQRNIPSDEGPPTPPRGRPGQEPPRKNPPRDIGPYVYVKPTAACQQSSAPAAASSQSTAPAAHSRSTPSRESTSTAASPPSAADRDPGSKRGSIESALVAMGYAEEAAQAAALRFSTAEAAVDWLASQGGSQASPQGAAGGEDAYLGARAPPGQTGPVEKIVGGERIMTLYEDGEDEEPALDMFGILRALGFKEADIQAAVERCSTVEAAVDYIMHRGQESGSVARAQAPPPARLLPALDGMAAGAYAAAAAVGSYAASVVRGSGAAEEPQQIVDTKTAEITKMLMDMGVAEDKAIEAARRCSSVEAAFEWLSQNEASI